MDEYVAGFTAGARWAQTHIDGLAGVSLSAQQHASLSDAVINEAAQASAFATAWKKSDAESQTESEVSAVAEVETTESSEEAQVDASAAETVPETPAEDAAELSEADAATA